jgi:hypothetical protein
MGRRVDLDVSGIKTSSLGAEAQGEPEMQPSACHQCGGLDGQACGRDNCALLSLLQCQLITALLPPCQEYIQ